MHQFNQPTDKKIVTTNRECYGVTVPAGIDVTIPVGQFITLTQTTPNKATVIYNGDMVQLQGEELTAIGLEPELIEFSVTDNGSISKENIETALGTVYDPEMPVNILELGLVYGIDIEQESKTVKITMTLTSPTCPMGDEILRDVKASVAQVPNVKTVDVKIVFQPPWTREMMSEEAQLETGMIW